MKKSEFKCYRILNAIHVKFPLISAATEFFHKKKVILR